MPYLFYWFGMLQKMFGPGLKTGRYVSFVQAVLILGLLWWVLRHYLHPWAGTIAVWGIAISPLSVVIYNYAVSQIVVAFFMALGIFFLIGDDRSSLSLYAASLFFSVMALMRMHMIVVTVFALGYIWLNYGRQVFLKAAAISIAILFLGCWVYWPEIMRLWQNYLPALLKQRLPGLIPTFSAKSVWYFQVENVSMLSRLHSIAIAISSEMAIVFIQLIGLFFVSWKDQKWTKNWLKIFVPAYFLLYGIFVWNTLTTNYCVDCVKVYARFLTPLGAVNSAIILLELASCKCRIRSLFPFLASVFFGAIMGYSVFEYLGEAALYWPIPKVWDGKIFESTTLWTILESKFWLKYADARLFAPVIVGMLLVFILMFVSGLISIAGISFYKPAVSYPYVFFGLFLLTSSIFWDITYFESRACLFGYNVFKNERLVGEILDTYIPENALVFWDGGSSISPLLYVDGIRTFPQQYNQQFAHFVGGDTDLLLKYGFYNDEALQQWLTMADYVIANRSSAKAYRATWSEMSLDIKVPLGCTDDTSIYLFSRPRVER